jgi:radical SAM-linked protein
LRQECRAINKKRLNFNITISNFTPKPHTPFQWHSVSTAEFKRKQELLRQEFRPMKGVKVNYTDVRISAMEDFVGRGDRRLATVVRRAWELGAGMDSWWESLDKAFAAWERAIAEGGLTWKYRQVENGEWNVFDKTGVGAKTLRVEKRACAALPEAASPLLNAPLPWDHLNTGIDKEWLKTDLQRALEAATVPDCAFDGCSHCGVCGIDFGHNVVIPPPPIPEFAGHFRPNRDREQRIRVWFGKKGQMALVSHLDLVRLFDRAVRRAALPISFTGGYHPGPKISIANALSLGATSSGEIVDFELTREMSVEEFRERLVAQLPADIPVYRVEEVDVKSPAATRLLEKAEYLISVGTADEKSVDHWQQWIEAINNSQAIWSEKTTKSGKKQTIDLRDRLFALTLESTTDLPNNLAVLRYVGSCRNDGTKLSPEQIVSMLEQVAQQEFQLLKVHRQQLMLVE